MTIDLAECAVPGCETLTANGICDECDQWVTEQVALDTARAATLTNEDQNAR